MKYVPSKDGTTIAFERSGEGPLLILVDGALCYSSVGSSTRLAAPLSERFTVFTYDRRGRGNSGDTAPHAVEREIEDLQTLIEEAGGSACLYGVSSARSSSRAIASGAVIKALAFGGKRERRGLSRSINPLRHRTTSKSGARRRGPR